MEVAIVCPSCRKRRKGATDQGTAEVRCQRCDCNLTRPVAIRQRAFDLRLRALQNLRRGDYQETLAQAEASWTLDHDRETPAVGLLAAVRLRDNKNIALWISRKTILEDLQSLPAANRL